MLTHGATKLNYWVSFRELNCSLVPLRVGPAGLSDAIVARCYLQASYCHTLTSQVWLLHVLLAHQHHFQSAPHSRLQVWSCAPKETVHQNNFTICTPEDHCIEFGVWSRRILLPRPFSMNYKLITRGILLLVLWTKSQDNSRLVLILEQQMGQHCATQVRSLTNQHKLRKLKA